VQFHIELDGALPLFDAHAVGARLRLCVLDAVPGSEVMIHLDPTGDSAAPR
jgi:ferrous-iron efflux pump FieF